MKEGGWREGVCVGSALCFHSVSGRCEQRYFSCEWSMQPWFEEVALNLCKVFSGGNICTSNMFPIQDQCSRIQLRRFLWKMIHLAGGPGAPLLGNEGQETTGQCQQAPRALAEGLLALRPLLSAVMTFVQGRNLHCAASCILSLTTLMGCNTNHPRVTEWLFVDWYKNNKKKDLEEQTQLIELTHLEIFPEALFEICMHLAYACFLSARRDWICRSWNRPLDGLSGKWRDISSKTENFLSRAKLFWKRWPKLPFLITISIQSYVVLGVLLLKLGRLQTPQILD